MIWFLPVNQEKKRQAFMREMMCRAIITGKPVNENPFRIIQKRIPAEVL